MSRADAVSRALGLRASGASLRQIADVLGCSVSTASDYVNDPDGSKARARKASYGGRCVQCGASTDGSNGRSKAPRYCHLCDPHGVWWTHARLVERFRTWHERYGEPPVAQDWNPETYHDPARRALAWERWHADRWPPVSVVQKVYGSWNAGVTAAGFTALPSGYKRHQRRAS